MKTKLTLKDARYYGDLLGIDYDTVPLSVWRYGMTVELEHGRVDKRTNVTDDNLLATAKIALAHLLEYPDYYQRLKVMEEKADKYWKGRYKPNVLY